jgi:prepilin signal peptidase PulO-like enzyme (type II secretory pathway)
MGRGSVGAVVGAVAFALVATLRGRRPPAGDGAAPAAADGEDEVDPEERRRLDVYWAGAWGGLIGRQLAVVNFEALMVPGWPLTFRVLNQVDTPVAGCIVTGGLFFIVAWLSHAALGRTGLGGGDIKLAGLIGAALGAGGGLVAAFVGIMLGGVVAAVLLVSGRRRFGEYLPFGPFLAAGGIVSAVWGRAIMEWYLG